MARGVGLRRPAGRRALQHRGRRPAARSTARIRSWASPVRRRTSAGDHADASHVRTDCWRRARCRRAGSGLRIGVEAVEVRRQAVRSRQAPVPTAASPADSRARPGHRATASPVTTSELKTGEPLARQADADQVCNSARDVGKGGREAAQPGDAAAGHAPARQRHLRRGGRVAGDGAGPRGRRPIRIRAGRRISIA